MARKRREKSASPNEKAATDDAGYTPTPRPPGAWDWDSGTLLLPFLCGVLLWLPSLRGDFLYDDFRMIVNNPVLRDPGNIEALFRFDPARPLLTLSWVASALYGGIEPWAFRLPNLLLHGATSALVALLVRWLAVARGDARPGREALVAGLFFAATPMAAETVAYVSSRSTGLCTFFGFAFLAAAARELQAPRFARRAAAWALLLLALLSKEEAAAFPLLLVLLDLHGPARGRWAGVVDRWRIHVPFLAVPVLGLGVRRAVVGSWLPDPVWPYDVWLPSQALELPAYLLRALVPLDPLLHRGTSPAAWPPDGREVLLAAALLALVFFVVRRSGARLSFAALWMAASLAPSSTLVSLKELAVDHRAYAGGFGVAWVAAGVLAGPGRLPLAAAALVVMGARALAAQSTLATAESAWAAVVERNPDEVEARLGLGLARLQARDHAAAVEHFERVTALTPGDARGWSNLAAALAGQERFVDALVPMERAVRLTGDDSRMVYNLGALQAQAGRVDLAEATFAQAIELKPPVPQALLALGTLRLARGDVAQAEALLARAEALRMPRELRPQLERLRRDVARKKAQSLSATSRTPSR